jgi:hypothetical protein
MDKSMERAETDRIWPIIETLKWVLNEMLDVSGTNQMHSKCIISVHSKWADYWILCIGPNLWKMKKFARDWR